ncbi:MAG: hypothetical protein ACAH80_04060 [Alphaproteobacteria bacterium]
MSFLLRSCLRPVMVVFILCAAVAWTGNTFAAKASAASERAMQKWGASAESGDNEAAYQIGIAYMREGRKDEAKRWLAQAAERDYVAAQMTLAQVYLSAGNKEDDARGAAWVKRAAEAGNTDAQLALAFLCKQGRGVAQDSAQAAEWFTRAAEAGNAEAKFRLAVAYYSGDGVSQDYAEAARLFRGLADNGNPAAQHNLAIMYREGQGVARDEAEAVAWQSLAVQGYGRGAERDALVRELEAMRAKLAGKDKTRAKRLYDEKVGGLVKARVATVKAPPALPPDQTRARAEADPTEDEKSPVSGFVQMGVRVQTNANNSSSSYLGDPTLPPVVPLRDTNWFFLGKATWLADLHSPRATNIETGVTLYRSYQNDSSVADISFIELTTGPNIPFRGGTWKNTLRPYLTGSLIETNNDLYQTSGGFGLAYKGIVNKDTALLLSAEETWAGVQDSAAAPANSDLSGRQTELNARFLRRLLPRVTGNLSVTARNYEAERGWYSYDSYAIVNGYAVKLVPVFKSLPDHPVSLYGSVSFQQRFYDDPNPPVSPVTTREDDEWQFTLTAQVPVTESLSIAPTVQHTRRDSNLTIYKYRNTATSISAIFRF